MKKRESPARNEPAGLLQSSDVRQVLWSDYYDTESTAIARCRISRERRFEGPHDRLSIAVDRHDSQALDALTHEGDPETWLDSGYSGQPCAELLAAKSIPAQVCEKGVRSKPLTRAQKRANHNKSKRAILVMLQAKAPSLAKQLAEVALAMLYEEFLKHSKSASTELCDV